MEGKGRDHTPQHYTTQQSLSATFSTSRCSNHRIKESIYVWTVLHVATKHVFYHWSHRIDKFERIIKT